MPMSRTALVVVWISGWLASHCDARVTPEYDGRKYGCDLTTRPFLTNQSVCNSLNTLTELKILSPVPMSGGYEGGWTMRIGALIGQDLINSQQRILPGYLVNDIFFDDKCSPDYGVQLMLEEWYEDKTWVAMGANGCSAVCMKCATVTPEIRLPQISYGCASGALSNTVRFPMMSRMMVVENSMADVFLALGTAWKWVEIHIITGDPARFDAPAKHNMAFFKSKPGNIGAQWLAPRNPNWVDTQELMGRVKTSQQRVINALGYEPFFRKVICGSFKVGMPKGAVFMSVGWHKSGWWNDFDPAMMDKATGFEPICDTKLIGLYYDGGLGATGLGQPAASAMDEPCDCYNGWTPRLIRAEAAKHFVSGYPVGMHQLPGEPYWGIMANGLDGICVWAFSLRHMLFDLKYKVTELQRPERAPYTEITRFLKKDLIFKGAMGTVNFQGNDLPGILAVYQIQRAIHGDITRALVKLLVATVDLLGVMSFVPGTKFMFGDGDSAPGSTFKACPPGTSLSIDGICEKCTPGRYHDCAFSGGKCAGSKNCMPCPEAFYSPLTGGVDLSSCKACGVGKFNDQAGSAACTDCTKGKVANTLGMTVCEQCLPGEFSEVDGMSGCDRCAKGMFSDEKGVTQCTFCPTGKETFGLGARGVDECVCITGTYLSKQDTCKACPKKMVCAIGSKEVNVGTDKVSPQLEEGYWASKDNPFSVFLCGRKTDCPGGDPETCDRGLAKHACGRCPDKWELSTSGKCEPCGNQGMSRAALGLAVCIFMCFALALVHMFVNWPPVLLLRTNMMGIFLGGMAVTSFLILNIYASLDSIWGPPLSAFFDAVKIFKFDLQAISMSCMMGSDSRVGKYAVKLMAFPIASGMLISGLFVIYCIPKARPFTNINRESFINTAGLLVAIFFISICAIAMEGFNCAENPNGLKSLSSDRSIVCWEGSEHMSYVVLSIFGLVAYPIAFLALTGILTYNYDKWALSGGVRFVLRARFLVARMKPEYYFFGFYYNLRNFVLALAPVLLTGQLGIQVFGLMTTFVFWLLVQCHYLPWRFPILNYFDAFSSSVNILLLICFAMLDATVDSALVGWFIIIIFTTGIVTMGVVAASKLAMRFNTTRPFCMFLCHAKAGAGLFIRQVKMMFQLITTRQIFLDLDNLENLDNLSFTVRAHTDNLLIIFTKETLTRFWCGVEVVSAYANNTLTTVAKVYPKEFPGELLEEEFMANVDKIWGPQELVEMEKLGITLDEVETSYRHFNTLPTYECPFEATLKQQNDACRTLLPILANCPLQPTAHGVELGQGICVVYDTKSWNQCCVARVMDMLLSRSKWQNQLCDGEFEERSLATQVASLSKKGGGGANIEPAAVSIIFMGKGFLANGTPMGYLGLLGAWKIPMVTVLSMEDFPNLDKPWFAEFRNGGSMDQSEQAVMRKIGSGDGTEKEPTNNEIADLYEGLLKILAWRLNPTESETVINVELSRILDRVKKAKGGTVSATGQ